VSSLEIPTLDVFWPLLDPAPYKGAHGGRSSGKSHFFAELMVEEHYAIPGLRSVCVREVQKDLKDSAKLLIEDKIQQLGLSEHFKVQREMIETPGGGQIIFRGMNDYNAESIKSLEGFDRAWIEEAQTLSDRSLMLLRPTIRKEGSQIWASWNPRKKTDAIDRFLRGPSPPPGAVVVEANWRDNKFFPAKLEMERLHDQAVYPDQYAHIWEGDYVTIFSGAYYAQQLTAAKQGGRVTELQPDPLLTLRAAWDLGGTGQNADATAIWIYQNVGPKVLVLDYYEAVGQPLAVHVSWLRDNGYQKALCVLPHDGVKHDTVYDVTPAKALEAAGFATKLIPNQGKGAAMRRIEAARRLFPNIWFDPKTQPGLDALGAYHERKDEARGIGLGPEHDWASHGADAFGLLCVDHEEPTEQGWSAPIKTRVRVV
jgi:phage terminase large subunit